MRTLCVSAIMLLFALLGRAAGPGGGADYPVAADAHQKVGSVKGIEDYKIVGSVQSGKLEYKIWGNGRDFVATLIGWVDSYDYYPEIVVPATVAFNGKSVPVTAVNGWAFSNGWGITSVKLGANVRLVGEYAFFNCALTKVTIPKSVLWILDSAFKSCPLTDVIFKDPHALTPKLFIGPFAFACLRIKNFEIPARISSKSFTEKRNIFGWNPYLESITLNPAYAGKVQRMRPLAEDDGEDESEYGALEIIDEALCLVCGEGSGRTVSVVAYPNALETESFRMSDNRVEVFGDALSHCHFKSIYLQATAASATPGCKIAVYDGAFTGCDALTTLAFVADGEVQLSGSMSLECPNLGSYDLGGGITNYSVDGDVLYAYGDGGRTLVSYPGGRSDREIVVPDDVTAIGADAIGANVNVEKVILPAGLKNIGDRAFWGCVHLAEAKLPPAVEMIGTEAFANTALREISIPASVRALDSGAFNTQEGLEKVTVEFCEPPVNSAGEFPEWLFNPNDLLTATLVIPKGVDPQVFTSHEAWRFVNVENAGGASLSEYGDDAARRIIVAGLAVSASDGSKVELWRPDGILVAIGSAVVAPAPGIYIVRSGDEVYKLSFKP